MLPFSYWCGCGCVRPQTTTPTCRRSTCRRPTCPCPDKFSEAGEGLGSAAQAEELAIPLIVIVLAVGLAVASLYVIYIAPMIFAEVLVDGAMSYALYRHLRGEDPHHWLMTAIRRSILPFLATAVFVSIVGACMAAYVPGARSIGEVTRHVAGK